MFGRWFGALIGRYKISFYGDFIDPFCCVGFANLKAALRAPWSLAWRGFEMNLSTPPEGMPLAQAGNSDVSAGIWPSVQAYAEASGVKLARPAFCPNTRKAHGLVLGAPAAVKNPLIERIYQAYFSGQKNIGDMSVLIDIASGFGISEALARDAAESPGLVARLDSHRQEAIRLGFSGLPAYQAGKQRYFGALSIDAWQRIFSGRQGGQ